jgi:hypothetical protein
MMDKENVLLPCPFCGGKDVGGAMGLISCYSCGVEVDSDPHRVTSEMSKMWNTRAYPSPWIPVSSSDKPQDGEIVWIFASKPMAADNFQTDAEFKGSKFFLWVQEQEEHLDWEPNVTHWMPLPEPPQ